MHRGESRFVEHRQPFLDVALRDAEAADVVEGESHQVAVAEARRELERAPGKLERAVEPPLLRRILGLAPRKVRMLDAFRLVRQKALRALEPRGLERLVQLGEVVDRDPQRLDGGAAVVAVLEIRRERALARVDAVVEPAAPPGGLSQVLEPLRAELLAFVRAA